MNLDPFSVYVYLTIFNCHLHKTENAEKVTELFGFDTEDVCVATLHGFMKSLDASQLDEDSFSFRTGGSMYENIFDN